MTLKALMAAAIPSPEAGKMADQFLGTVTNLILPELAPAKEEFSKTSHEDMDLWRGKVIQISGNTATMLNNEDVADELMENVEAVRQATAGRRARKLFPDMKRR